MADYLLFASSLTPFPATEPFIIDRLKQISAPRPGVKINYPFALDTIDCFKYGFFERAL
ncbi:hypothetical protein EYZ11_005025 [Aspergillus tanneri]|uniref:Uncharacterized protein n=1 Tax=Aspergillus tanneri TaxID=1220188 RepID=A0A4S3JJL9_9EURO|nr:hypothetical protein EYZ11_005025 [Aspergillus tanneri]